MRYRRSWLDWRFVDGAWPGLGHDHARRGSLRRAGRGWSSGTCSCGLRGSRRGDRGHCRRSSRRHNRTRRLCNCRSDDRRSRDRGRQHGSLRGRSHDGARRCGRLNWRWNTRCCRQAARGRCRELHGRRNGSGPGRSGWRSSRTGARCRRCHRAFLLCNGFEHISRPGDVRKIDFGFDLFFAAGRPGGLRGGALRFGVGAEVGSYSFCFVFFQRTGMGLLLGHPDCLQYIEDSLALNFQFPG